MSGRVGLCFASAPLATFTVRGRKVHRHCVRPAGHADMHEIRGADNVPLYYWIWDDDDTDLDTLLVRTTRSGVFANRQTPGPNGDRNVQQTFGTCG